MYAPQDIVWPGEALKPPEGLPERRFIRASFLEEDPYVMLNPPTTCTSNKGIICQIKDNDYIVNNNINVTEEKARTNSSIYRSESNTFVTFVTFEKFWSYHVSKRRINKYLSVGTIDEFNIPPK